MRLGYYSCYIKEGIITEKEQSYLKENSLFINVRHLSKKQIKSFRRIGNKTINEIQQQLQTVHYSLKE